MLKLKIQKMVLCEIEIKPDKIEFIDTGNAKAMAETRCSGHGGDLGYENPKASVKAGEERFLLCRSCWEAQLDAAYKEQLFKKGILLSAEQIANLREMAVDISTMPEAKNHGPTLFD